MGILPKKLLKNSQKKTPIFGIDMSMSSNNASKMSFLLARLQCS